jgi:hypothetical protein
MLSCICLHSIYQRGLRVLPGLFLGLFCARRAASIPARASAHAPRARSSSSTVAHALRWAPPRTTFAPLFLLFTLAQARC